MVIKIIKRIIHKFARLWELVKGVCSLSPAEYLLHNPDVAAAGANPYWHYIWYGFREGRATTHRMRSNNSNESSIVKRELQKTSGKRSTCDIVRLPTYNRLTDEDAVVSFGKQANKSLEKYAYCFSDDSVMAVLAVNTGSNSPAIVSAYELATKHEDKLTFAILPEQCIVRAAAGFSVPQEAWEDAGLFTNMLLRRISMGTVVLVPDANQRSKTAEISEKAFVERLVLLMELYGVSSDRAAAALEDRRLSLGVSATDSLPALAAEKSAGNISKRRIMVSVLSFTFGGGEIMPIRLANGLHRAGWPVLVHILDRDTTDPRVRKMLNFDIPVIYTNNCEEFGEYASVHGVDIISTHHQGTQCICAEMMHATGMRVRHVATTHGMYEASTPKEMKLLTQMLFDYVDAWTCVADKNLPPLQEYGLLKGKPFFKLPNGMDLPTIAALKRADYGIPEDAFVFCTVSRALMKKGWLEATEAIRIARRRSGLDLHLLLVGDGEALDRLSAAPQEPFIHLMGYQGFPCDWYSISDAGLLPSWYGPESTPLTLIECLQCGKPFLATDVGEIAQMLSVREQMAGIVFPLTDGRVDVAVLADKMVEMATDKDAYRKMCALAQKKAPEYSLDTVTHKYLDVFNLGMEPADNQLVVFHGMYERSLQLLRRGRSGKNCPHVTVIVPNYNHEKYLRQRLDCIYDQTYENFDVLLLDDCSKDGSPDILREYAQRYPQKTTLMMNDTNSGGVFHQWRKGIKAASGELCWIAESDDWCELTFLEKLVPLFMDRKVRIASAHYFFCMENGQPMPRAFETYLGEFTDAERWERPFVREADELVRSALAVGNCLPNASGLIFRRPECMELLEDAEWSSMRICGDWLFYLHAARGGCVAYTNLTHSYFRTLENSAGSSTYKSPAYYHEHEVIIKSAITLYPLTREALDRAENRIRNFARGEHAPESSLLEYHAESIRAALEEKKTADAVDIVKLSPLDTVFVSALLPVTESDESEPEKAMDKLGLNTGNLLFNTTLRHQVNASISVEDPYADDYSTVVGLAGATPVSNLIHIGGREHVPDTLRLYEQTDFPLTMVGLGAQADLLTSPEQLVASIDEDRKRLFKLASERAVTLGVRGSFSGKCLEALGIYNYRVVGCPSAYMNLDGVMPPMRSPSLARPIICVTRNQAAESTPAMQSKIIRMGMEQSAEWIVQMLTELPQGVLEGRVPKLDEIKLMYPQENWENTDICRYVAGHTHIFFRYESWQQYLRQGGFTFAFGSRFHGIMAAIHAGIPGLLLAHDSRTLELAQTLHLPYITPEQFAGIEAMEQLLELCDYSGFYKNYGALTARYIRFLEENGMTVRS